MDQPEISEQDHFMALRGLQRINKVSMTATRYWKIIRKLAQTTGGLSVLDVATGAGDIPTELALHARSERLKIMFSACDKSATAISYATRFAAASEASVNFFVADALRENLPKHDIIICSLFLHHLDPHNALRLIENIARSSRKLVIISDLRRTFFSFGLTYVATRLLTTSRIVHVDGPRSVRAAYSMTECVKLASDAGLKDIHVERQWPFRFLLQGTVS